MESPSKLSGELKSSLNSTSDFSGTGNDILYQVSTIDALLQGVYDGVLSFRERELPLPAGW